MEKTSHTSHKMSQNMPKEDTSVTERVLYTTAESSSSVGQKAMPTDHWQLQKAISGHEVERINKSDPLAQATNKLSHRLFPR